MKHTRSKKMHGEITMRILEAIENTALGVVDMVDIMLSSGYGASQAKMIRELERRQSERMYRLEVRKRESEIIQKKTQEESAFQQRTRQMISMLERDGLIKKLGSSRRAAYVATGKGKLKLKTLQDRYENALPAFQYTKARRTKQIVIVIFDIPERERRKRTWLRQALDWLEFQPLQKSVWMGQATLPMEFVHDLRDLKLTPFTEIFEVTKRGSIAKII